MLSVRREVSEFRKRYKWMALVAILCFLVIVSRLVYLQIVDYDHWAAEARQNITKRVRLPATRGIIVDRHSHVIADNRPAYNVFVTPQLMGDEDIERLAELMHLTDVERVDFREKLSAVPERRRSHMIKMFEDITRDQYAAIETHNRELPAVQTVVVPVRTYPYESLGAHAVGFLNEVNAEDLERLKGQGYRAGQHIGRSGIEKAWESYLRGHDGELKIVVDVQGREFKGESRLRKRSERKEPVPGRNLRLTLDMGIMRSVQRAFGGRPSGAAVVVDVRTGYVRAIYSKPSYDLNEMSGRLTLKRAQELEENPFRPLIDKSIYESYFPGSTFKPISALAALQEGLVNGSEHYECTGYYELGNRKFRCGHIHGDIDLHKAITQSCNVYFYRLGQQVGLDRLAKYAREFGLGEPTGLGINTEASGFIPTRNWYKEHYGEHYRLGFTLNAAIGQGNTRVTVMQLAMAYAAIANGGTLYVPQIVEAIENPDGTTVAHFEPKVRRQVEVDPMHLTTVMDGMFGVVNEYGGTAFDERIEGGVAVAGKTGTAQVSQRRPRPGEDPKRSWFFRRSHAWFAGYAPAEDPQLAVVVLVEHGGDGGKHAAPVALRVLQEALANTTQQSTQLATQHAAHKRSKRGVAR